MEINVRKRNGTLEKFSVQKLKEMISWACSGLDVNHLALEAKIEEFLKDEISTIEIHQNLIHYAKTLCSFGSPDWTIVAGRLQTMLRWKDTMAYDMEFVDFVKEKVQNGEYSGKLLQMYSDEDLKYFGDIIEQDRDLSHSIASVITAEQKYLQEGECIQQMFMVNALVIAGVEESKDIRNTLVEKIYEALSLRKISLATPWLANLRTGDNISSCFIIQLDDSIESIFDNVKRAALISKEGGGLGIDFSKIRATGSSVNGRKNASKGVTGWIKIFNDTAVVVDQGGRRAGAFTVALPVWHRDIEDFLEIQSEVGDQRKKAHDVFPQVTTPDIFWKKVESDEDWFTFCPYEVKKLLGVSLTDCFGEDFEVLYNRCIEETNQGNLVNVKKYKAKNLVKHIMRTQFETGLPYIVFTDTINEANPNSHIGNIPCVNLCVESYSVLESDTYGHTCNLASVVVGRMESFDDIIKYSALTTHILDNGITLTKPPVDISKKHNDDFRTIGVGIQGLHDWVAKRDLTYKDYEELGKVAEALEYGCVLKSVELATLKGSYPKFEGSKWYTGEMVNRFKRHGKLGLDWDYLQDKINHVGIRNSQLTSPAPNTSTSIFMDAAAGVMPCYAPFFIEANKNGDIPVSSMFIKENPISYMTTFGKYDQSDLSKCVGEIQKHIDTGISAEYLFDQNKQDFSAKKLYELLISAWKNKTKAVYYIRSIKKGQSVDNYLGNVEEACENCSA